MPSYVGVSKDGLERLRVNSTIEDDPTNCNYKQVPKHLRLVECFCTR